MKQSSVFSIPKEILDTTNSISWFLLDAFWMLDWKLSAYFFLVPTVVSGLLLIPADRRRPVVCINLAINCWIFMNAFWMISDLEETPAYLTYAKAFFGIGLVFIGAAAATSQSLMDTFSHFRRFRMMRFR